MHEHILSSQSHTTPIHIRSKCILFPSPGQEPRNGICRPPRHLTPCLCCLTLHYPNFSPKNPSSGTRTPWVYNVAARSHSTSLETRNLHQGCVVLSARLRHAHACQPSKIVLEVCPIEPSLPHLLSDEWLVIVEDVCAHQHSKTVLEGC